MLPKSKKDQTFRRLSSIVLQLEMDKGHLKWKVMDVERQSKLSRSLVYRYFGSTKEEILRSAIQIFTHEFYGFGEDSEEISFVQRITRTREYVIKNPGVVLFYLKAREGNTWISKEFVAIEKRFQKNLRKSYPDFDDSWILAVHAFIHGMVTAPFLSSAQAGAIAQMGLFQNDANKSRPCT